MAALSIVFIGEDDYDKQILMHEGVPENALLKCWSHRL